MLCQLCLTFCISLYVQLNSLHEITGVVMRFPILREGSLFMTGVGVNEKIGCVGWVSRIVFEHSGGVNTHTICKRKYSRV